LVIIEDGTVVQEGTLEAITSHPRTQYVAELSGLNLLRGKVSGSEVALEGGGTFHTTSRLAGDILVVIAPRDIALYLDPPAGSPRNTWSTRVSEVHLLGDRARVLLGAPIRVAAEITAVSLSSLGLTEGDPVWASVKATQIDVYPEGTSEGP
jgi:molybdate transport system ATP-binding protein